MFSLLGSADIVACMCDHVMGFGLPQSREVHQYCLELLPNAEPQSMVQAGTNGRDKTRIKKEKEQ